MNGQAMFGATSIRSVLKTIPGAVEINAALTRNRRRQLDDLGVFTPHSAGTLNQLLELALADGRRIFPFLTTLLESAGAQLLTPIEATSFPQTSEERRAAETLATHFDRYGSDKSNTHNYHLVYGPILSRGQFAHVLEVGLGTNNEDVVSNMGAQGKPGASLRAFRDYLPAAHIYGADIDRRVLFSDDRIRTFHVDQLDLDSFRELTANTPDQLDLVIDDGLHSPAANVAVLNFAINKLGPRGWVVVEDIAPAALPVWQVVAQLLPSWTCTLVNARDGYMFVARRAHAVS